MRAMMGNRANFERHMTLDDLLLVPPYPEDMGLLDWQRHGELKDATYSWAQGEIARLAHTAHPALAGAPPASRTEPDTPDYSSSIGIT
jgi:hypothetical protein